MATAVSSAAMEAKPRFQRSVLLAKLREVGIWVPDDVYVDVFGNTRAMAAELGALVCEGKKRATASLLWALQWEGMEVPKVGEREVVIDWDGNLLAVIETTEVEIVPFDAVGADFARDEGEGDLSLAFWRQVHWEYFTGECELIGRALDKNMPVVCQRFRRIYPNQVVMP